MKTDIKTSARSGKRLLTLAATASIAALAVAGTRFYAAAEAPAEEIVVASAPAGTVANPTVRNIVEWDEYTGRFRPIDNVEIRARVSGYLTEIAFENGQIVQEGDLLFRIDPRPFEAELAAAEAELASARAEVENARAEYSRGRRLVEREAISQEAVDQRLRAQRQAEAGLAAAEAGVVQAQLNLEFTEVRAPISGRISDDYVSEGNLIVGGAQGGTLLTTVVSMSPIHFEFTASEAEYLKYTRLNQSGDRADLRGETNPVSLRLIDEDNFAHDGTISFVDNRLDPSTGTMRARAVFDNEDGVFAPGMFGRLRLAGSGEYDAILIPDSAVQTDQSEKFVWIADDADAAQRRRITLGPIVDGLRVVRSGLAADDRVIVSGTQFVMAGAPVAPQAPDAPRLAQLNLVR